ncbi:MAG: RNA polymerase Rpb6 [Crocinitomicaceae bacterium]|nr:RNA polymerase Rpb6 [Crocinitomicaceae bacterium]|tara:strand:+ start:153 stop:482 length:330 start_codon:yes stop_codon:yes gene_type:complete
MDYKKGNAAGSTITRNIREISKPTGNIYEAIAVVAKRADQISIEMKEELTSKLEEFASHTDNLEEIFENREQIEISKFYERLPKPTAISMEEFMNGEIYFRNPAKQNAK